MPSGDELRNAFQYLCLIVGFVACGGASAAMSFTSEEWKADYEGVKGQIIQVRGDGGTERTVSGILEIYSPPGDYFSSYGVHQNRMYTFT